MSKAVDDDTMRNPAAAQAALGSQPRDTTYFSCRLRRETTSVGACSAARDGIGAFRWL